MAIDNISMDDVREFPVSLFHFVRSLLRLCVFRIKSECLYVVWTDALNCSESHDILSIYVPWIHVSIFIYLV